MKTRRALRWSLCILSAVGAGVAVAVATNPSYDRHLEKTAQTMHDQQAAHVAVCPKCTKVEGFNYWAMITMQVHVRHGFDYRNYGVFSVVSPGGLRQAQTIGFCGMVFGPHLASGYVCPADIPITVEMPPLHKTTARQVVFHVAADGTLRHEEAVITEDEAAALVAGLEQKEETAIIFRADAHARLAQLTGLIDRLTGKQAFGSVRISVEQGDDAGDRKE